MKLPLKLGIPLLVALVLALGFSEGRQRLPFLFGAMGVALWTAFSLPHPGPRRPEDVDPTPRLVPPPEQPPEPQRDDGDGAHPRRPEDEDGDTPPRA